MCKIDFDRVLPESKPRTLKFKHIAVGSRFAEQGILGERRYEKIDENHVRLVGHDHPSFKESHGSLFGLGRIDKFDPEDDVQPINHQ